ncbi:hypothetical protein [Loigolactobacillus binensis]|uniref:Uncharacterized protein n=1 Tax=Loigolactobacillus binensis TaxID=2559922 RepID=A0ABW3ECM1_9LACO|nr:hypothetical protein [Loigolactobacillus binensis]
MNQDTSTVTTSLNDKIKELAPQPIAQWLDPFIAIFKMGMETGIGTAYLQYVSEVNKVSIADIATQAPEFEQENLARTQQIAAVLSKRLDDEATPDFKAMDIKVRIQIVNANKAGSWDEARMYHKAELAPSDFVETYFDGFEYGYQLSLHSALSADEQQALSAEECLTTAEKRAKKEAGLQHEFTLNNETVLAQTYADILQALK